MVGFPKYESYKDSGVEWLGEIPSSWNIKRLKFLGNIKTGEKDTVNSIDDGKYPFFVRSQTVERIDTYSHEEEAVLTAGDGGVGKVFHYINGKFDYHQRVYKVSKFREIIGKYLFYYMKSFLYEEVIKLSAKTTVDSLRLPMFLNFPIIYGEIEVQQRIVEFLDRKTSEIDQAIAQKQRLIELLQEQKAILINQAVTKGLDPNVPMCDRGIEWLGEIPSHWTIGKLKFFLKSIDYGLSESALSDGDYRYLNMGHIQNKKVLVKNTGYLNSITDNLLLETNDILFNRTNSFDLVGKSGIFKGVRTDKVTFASYLVRLRPVESVVPDWLNYLLNEVSFLSYIRSLALRSLNQANLNPNRLSAVHVAVPPTEEQIKISEFISNMENEINKQTAIAQRSIELYEELKKTYISNVVTGKIKV